MGTKDGKPAKPRGRKADKRPAVTFKVEEPVYQVLAATKAKTGNSPDETARELVHLFIVDPVAAVKVLEALLAPLPAKPEPNASPSNVHRLDASRQSVS